MADLYVTATMQAVPGATDRLRDLLLPAVESFRREQGCLAYTLLEDQRIEGRFTTFEQWRGAADLAAHMKSDTMNALEPKLKGLLAADMEQNLLTALEIL